MSVIITNVTAHDDPNGVHDYVVRINHGPVLARFSHVRTEGLAECLRRAADAVDAAREGGSFWLKSTVAEPSP